MDDWVTWFFMRHGLFISWAAYKLLWRQLPVALLSLKYYCFGVLMHCMKNLLFMINTFYIISVFIFECQKCEWKMLHPPQKISKHKCDKIKLLWKWIYNANLKSFVHSNYSKISFNITILLYMLFLSIKYMHS